ncbi:hypothetical protein ACEQPO_07360 [Bacillus sp. SL00103]
MLRICQHAPFMKKRGVPDSWLPLFLLYSFLYFEIKGWRSTSKRRGGKHVNMPKTRQMTKNQKTIQGDSQENLESG